MSKFLWKCWSNNIALSRIIKIKATTESPFLLILFSTSKLMSPYFDLLNVLLPAQILSYWCSFWKHGWDIDWLGTGKMIMHNYSIKEMLYVDWSGTLNIPKNKRWNKPMVTWRKHCISDLHFQKMKNWAWRFIWHSTLHLSTFPLLQTLSVVQICYLLV